MNVTPQEVRDRINVSESQASYTVVNVFILDAAETVAVETDLTIDPANCTATEAVEEGRVLSKDVIKVLLASFQERLDSEVMFNGQKGSLKSFIYLQARCVVRFLLKEAEYVPFCLGW